MTERTPAEIANLMVLKFRIMAVMFLGWAGMIVYLNETVLQHPAEQLDHSLFTVFSVITGLLAGGALLVRLKAVPAARRRILGADMAARMLWSFSYLGGLALSEAVVLFGFVLRFIGASTKQAMPFYASGLLLMLLFFPLRLETPLDSSRP